MPLPGPIRRAGGSRVASVVVDLLERLAPARRDGLAVLTLHRVAPGGRGLTPGTLSTTPEGLGELLDRLARRHALVDIETVVRRLDGGPALPPRALLMTIDDAYRDTAEHAWPVLKARGVPVVLFVPTAYPDAPERTFWWDRLHRAISASSHATVTLPDGAVRALTDPAGRDGVYRAFRASLKAMPHDALLETVDGAVASLGSEPARSEILGWGELRELARDGLTLAPHSRTHPLLTRLEASRLPDEIAGSRDDLAAATGVESAVFAYPSGAVDAAARAAVAAAGLRVAFSIERGVNDLRTADRLALRRINVAIGTPPALIHAQVVR